MKCTEIIMDDREIVLDEPGTTSIQWPYEALPEAASQRDDAQALPQPKAAQAKRTSKRCAGAVPLHGPRTSQRCNGRHAPTLCPYLGGKGAV